MNGAQGATSSAPLGASYSGDKRPRDEITQDPVTVMTENIRLAFDVVFGGTAEQRALADCEQQRRNLEQEYAKAIDAAGGKTTEAVKTAWDNLCKAQANENTKRAKWRMSVKDDLREFISKVKLEKAPADTTRKAPSRCPECKQTGDVYFHTDSKTGEVRCTSCRAVVKAGRVRCWNCNETDESVFRDDEKTGDKVCTKCGAVLKPNQMKDEDWARVKTDQDSGEVKSTMGDGPLQYRSDAYNLGTKLVERAGVSGSQMRQYKRLTQNAEKTMHRTEWSNGEEQFGRTRDYYKDAMKGTEFRRMEHVGEKLRLSRAVIDRAKFYFAQFRDSREKIHQKDKASAVCMIAAYEDITELQKMDESTAQLPDGRSVKQRRDEDSSNSESDSDGEGEDDDRGGQSVPGQSRINLERERIQMEREDVRKRQKRDKEILRHRKMNNRPRLFVPTK
eukprot:gb/GECG01000845.1/.p1 GENE.gb/GECG01000845.1/~~gb/GECG01000845.1/.p1  ORF type:complete len:448 (+),score=72.17 gb/GECG01000845.1/:1-1344(+)